MFWGRLKRERRQIRRTRTVFPVGRFSRISVEIFAQATESQPEFTGSAMGFLHDLSPEGIGLFVEKKLEIGETIDLVLPAPQRLELRGRVAWCREVPSYRVLKKKRLPYRIGVQFQFASSENRQALELICADLAVKRNLRDK